MFTAIVIENNIKKDPRIITPALATLEVSREVMSRPLYPVNIMNIQNTQPDISDDSIRDFRSVKSLNRDIIIYPFTIVIDPGSVRLLGCLMG